MSNGRIHQEETPERRIAAVVRSLTIQVNRDYRRTGHGPDLPDYADYCAAIAPFLEKELLLARLHELEIQPRKPPKWRIEEIRRELEILESKLPDEYRLKA